MSEARQPTKTPLPGLEYVPEAKTDVTRVWRKFGWLPKAELDAKLNAQQTLKRVSSGERTDAG